MHGQLWPVTFAVGPGQIKAVADGPIVLFPGTEERGPTGDANAAHVPSEIRPGSRGRTTVCISDEADSFAEQGRGRRQRQRPSFQTVRSEPEKNVI